jgi:hypothetical protein
LDSIACELKENIDEWVVIYLNCTCLTGILVAVSDDACKIVCRPPGARGRGRVTICRLDDIQAVAFCRHT